MFNNVEIKTEVVFLYHFVCVSWNGFRNFANL